MSVSVDIENKGYYFKSSSDESMHFKSTYDDKKFITFVIEITTTWREMCKIRKVLRFLDKSPVPLMVICSIESGYLINIKSIMKIIPDDYDIEAALSKLFIPVLHCSPALLQQTAHSSLEELKCIRILDFIPLFNKLKDDGIECIKENISVSRFSVRLIRPLTVIRYWRVSFMGQLYVHLYTHLNAKCISCSKCNSFLGIKAFLSHSHGIRQSGVGRGAFIQFYSGSKLLWNRFNQMRKIYENQVELNIISKPNSKIASKLSDKDFNVNKTVNQKPDQNNMIGMSPSRYANYKTVYGIHSRQFLMYFLNCPFLILPISLLDHFLFMKYKDRENEKNIFPDHDIFGWKINDLKV
ncbi:hypothetical protein GJ496_002553, partial [Pomphorhynchus laevis]